MMQKTVLAVGSVLWLGLGRSCESAAPPPVPAPEARCAEFQRRAYQLDVEWEQRPAWEEAVALLATYPPYGCAPAERVVLAKRAIRAPGCIGPLPTLLLEQGLRGQGRESGSWVDLAAQVELVQELVRQGRIELEPFDLERLRRLTGDEEGETQAAGHCRLDVLFEEYRAVAEAALRLRKQRALCRACSRSCKIPDR